MTTRQIQVMRFSVISKKPFKEVLAALEKGVGHPDAQKLMQAIPAAPTEADAEKLAQAAAGPTGLMELGRFDLGSVLRREAGAAARQCVRLLIGNPMVMKQMVKRVPDAGSYAPVTVLVDERADGVHLTYDRMASFLSPYGSEEALKVAHELDGKIEALMNGAA
jgi:uncharacterized protein (DUF302 family)